MQQCISYYTEWSCADPGFFRGGGGGWEGPGPTPRKQSEQVFALVFNLFYSLQRGSNGLFTEKIIFFLGGGGEGWGGGGGGSKCQFL